MQELLLVLLKVDGNVLPSRKDDMVPLLIHLKKKMCRHMQFNRGFFFLHSHDSKIRRMNEEKTHKHTKYLKRNQFDYHNLHLRRFRQTKMNGKEWRNTSCN